MLTCSNCGMLLPDRAKFCLKCGAPINNKEGTTSNQKQEYAGKVRKCPSCGMEISSFTAICPGCGHEFNSARVTSSIREFSILINKCDSAIAYSKGPKNGWKAWDKGYIILWVVLNIFTFCIPHLIYMFLQYLGIAGFSSFTVEENNKAHLISNFVFPNERESIIEGLLYIKSQISNLASGKLDMNTYRWIKIWENKASQLFEMAEALFKGDEKVKEAYADIVSNKVKAIKNLLIKTIIVVVLVSVFDAFIYSRIAR